MDKKKILSALVAGVMTMSAMGFTAMADDNLPQAEVSVLEPFTLAAGEHSVWYGSGMPVDSEVDHPLDVVMNFKALESKEAAAEGKYGEWLADFYLSFTGLEEGSVITDGCYLAGAYGSEGAFADLGWIVIPADGLEVKDGEAIPVMQTAGMPLEYATDICGSVKEFNAAIYIDRAILAANPDFEVSLELKMTSPDGTEEITIGEPAVYDVQDIVPLPTATVTNIENDDLTFAMNFFADEITDDQLDFYDDWYADFELTVNKDVTFNANGGADGYLSGSYEGWNNGAWVNVPFEDVTLEANTPLKIMEYAAELMGEPGLKYTYREVYEVVKDFDCGVFFEEDFLAANPDLVVTLELRMYNPVDETESYTIGDTYVFTIPSYENAYYGKFTGTGAYKDTVATAITTTVTPRTNTIEKITWTYGEKAVTYSESEISGEGSVVFGLIIADIYEYAGIENDVKVTLN